VSKYVISIVDDDESFREAMASLMKSLGFAVEAFSSAEQFLASPRLGSTSCLIADYNMPGATGLELHRQLVDSGRAIPVILVTAYPDDYIRARALAAGVICYLGKTFDEAALLGCVRSALMQADKGKPGP
jgi:FixJ family two-component response regulator